MAAHPPAGVEFRHGVVGKAQRKADGLSKATGEAVYTDDISLPRMAQGEVKGAAGTFFAETQTALRHALLNLQSGFALDVLRLWPFPFSALDSLPDEFVPFPKSQMYFAIVEPEPAGGSDVAPLKNTVSFTSGLVGDTTNAAVGPVTLTLDPPVRAVSPPAMTAVYSPY